MIKLSDFSTEPPKDADKKALREETQALTERLAELLQIMNAQARHSVLVVLQGMDASGKDGAVRSVFTGCNHNHINSFAFKRPTEEEFAHDFLWRVHKRTPQRGMLVIFNRSHYEDILIQRVHKWIDEERVSKRIAAINAFEELLEFDNHTLVLKFYLHISKEDQEKQLRQRLDDPTKHFKHNEGDWKEREHWDEYMRCYEDAINRSSIPWTVVPVDERWYRDYIIAKTIVERLEALNMSYPPLPKSKE